MLQSLIVLNYPQYNPKPWQAMLLMWVGLLVAVFLKTVVSNFLPKIEGAILIFHVVGFFAILIPLTYLAPSHGTASTVFTQFLNHGGWPSQGLSFWVGISSTVFMFLGRFLFLNKYKRRVREKLMVTAGADSVVHVCLFDDWVSSGSVLVNHGCRCPKRFTMPQ
jgi:hypothetical protein